MMMMMMMMTMMTMATDRCAGALDAEYIHIFPNVSVLPIGCIILGERYLSIELSEHFGNRSYKRSRHIGHYRPLLP